MSAHSQVSKPGSTRATMRPCLAPLCVLLSALFFGACAAPMGEGLGEGDDVNDTMLPPDDMEPSEMAPDDMEPGEMEPGEMTPANDPDGNPNPAPSPSATPPSVQAILEPVRDSRARLMIRHNITGESVPLANVRFVRGEEPATPEQCAAARERTNGSGDLDKRDSTHISYCFANGYVVHVAIEENENIIERDAANYKNLLRFVLSWHLEGREHIFLYGHEQTLELDFSAPVDLFERSLARQLLRWRRVPARIMERGVGVNLNSAGTQSPLVGPSLVFADLFRTATPFEDYSGRRIELPVDEHGWITEVPEGAVVLSSLIRGQTEGIPHGTYTVLYDGEGSLSYGGSATLVERTPGRDIIEIHPEASSSNQMWLRVNWVTAGNHIRNIRVVMPGGYCAINPSVHVMDASPCVGPGEYRSFEALLSADRNAFVFNPEMLWFLKDFSTMRLGAAMESTPQTPPDCRNEDGTIQSRCLSHVSDWEDRPSMDAFSFGSPGRYLYEDTRGIPIEALIALANSVEINPWIVFDPTMSDDYIREMAAYANLHLFEGATVYLELGNEMWNGHFLGFHYAERLGVERGYGDGDRAAAGREYYARRSVEVFDVYESNDSHDVYRVLAGFFRNAPLTEELLGYVEPGDIDGFGLAPYFYGCYTNVWPAACTDRELTPKTYFTSRSVEDVFEMLNNPNDPFAIDALFDQVETHAEIIERHGFEMIMYEGGQSLRAFSVQTGDAREEASIRWHITPLFEQANLDPRMAEMYFDFLARWRGLGGGPIVLYTSPRSYSMFGNFGITPALGTARADAPKYDAVLRWQEDVEPCGHAECVAIAERP